MRLGACSDAQAPSSADVHIAVDAPVAVEAAAPLPKASSIGIWALVLSLLGLVGLLPVVGSVLGFVLGWVGVRRTATRRVIGGRGLAVTAVVISLITLLAIVASMIVYALLIAYGTI